MIEGKKTPIEAVDELIGTYAELLNAHGIDSFQEREFLDRHRQNEEFVSLARTARFLRQEVRTKCTNCCKKIEKEVKANDPKYVKFTFCSERCCSQWIQEQWDWELFH